jgi:hypothetical protein
MNPFAEEEKAQTTPATPPMAHVEASRLGQMLRVLDACAQRGAFKCDEYLSVGALHQYLSTKQSEAMEQNK